MMSSASSFSPTSQSSNASSKEHTPDKRYQHIHPVYTFENYQRNFLNDRDDLKKPEHECYMQLFSSQNQTRTSNSLFQLNKNADQCKCMLFTQSKFCFHTLTSSELVLLPKALEAASFEHVNTVLGLPDNWHNAIKEISAQLEFHVAAWQYALPTPSYIKCGSCCIIQRATIPNVVPRHKCDKAKALRYGVQTTLRYITMFKTFNEEIIELNVTSVPLKYGDFHLLVPTISLIYSQLERLQLKTTILQLCCQDPCFFDLFGMIEYTNTMQELGVYSLYIYLEFRLLQFLTQLKITDITERLFPVYTMLVSDNEDQMVELLGYDRNEEVAEFCGKLRKERLTNLVVKKKQEQNDHYLQNFICDRMLANEEKYGIFASVMNKFRPIHEGVRQYVKTLALNNKWPNLDNSMWLSIRCTSGQPHLKKFSNIFGIIPSGQFRPSGDNLYKWLMLCSAYPYRSWQTQQRPQLFYRLDEWDDEWDEKLE